MSQSVHAYAVSSSFSDSVRGSKRLASCAASTAFAIKPPAMTKNPVQSRGTISERMFGVGRCCWWMIFVSMAGGVDVRWILGRAADGGGW